jgi:hypothetical protein
MKYTITTIVFGSPGFIEIDEAKYQHIKSAITNLFELLFFEEKLDLVTENFQEYEAELLLIASREMVFHDSDYYSMSNERNTVSRRIVNLLSAGRMYLDQSVHHFNNIYGENSDKSNLLEEEITSQYDQNFGYRAIEALRNYTQHRGFPIQSMKFSGEWLDIDNNETSRLLHTVIPLIKVSELAEDGKFKKSVLDEMLSIDGKDGIDIRPLIRDYIEGIGKIHEKVRDAIRPDVEQWEGVVNDVIKKYQNKFGSDASLAGLAIVAEDDDGHWIEKRTIFKEFIEKRKALERKNKVFVNLHKRYASNEIRKKDA